jgi:hypothetical protein
MNFQKQSIHFNDIDKNQAFHSKSFASEKSKEKWSFFDLYSKLDPEISH